MGVTRVKRFHIKFCHLLAATGLYVQTFLMEGSKDPSSCGTVAVLPCVSIQCFQKAGEKKYSGITERNRQSLLVL